MNKLYVLALAFAVLASPVVLGARVGYNGRMLLQANGSEGNSTGNSTTGNYTLTTLQSLVAGLNLSSVVENATVFAPTDEAFTPVLAALNVSSVADLTPEQQTTVTNVLALHVIPGMLINSTMVPMGETSLPNAAGTNTTVINNATGIYVTAGSNTAMVIDADQMLDGVNSIFHVINAVLLPGSSNSTA